MKQKWKSVMRSEWFYLGLAFGVAWLLTGILLLIFSLVLYRFSPGTGVISLGILLIYFLSNTVAGYIAGKGVLGKHYLAGIISGITYFVFLLVLSLLVNHTLKDFSGNFFVCVTMARPNLQTAFHFVCAHAARAHPFLCEERVQRHT